MAYVSTIEHQRRSFALLMLVIAGLTIIVRLCLAMTPLEVGPGGHGDCVGDNTYCLAVCEQLPMDRQSDVQSPVPPHASQWPPQAPLLQVLPLALLISPGPALSSPIASPLPGLWPTLRCRVLLI